MVHIKVIRPVHFKLSQTVHFKVIRVVHPFRCYLFRLKRAVSAYADFFQRTGIRVTVNFDKDIPKSIRKKVKALIHQLTAHMAFIDEINQYESQISKSNRK